eukprot:TRINITY_DN50037_c0_g1_i1.p1 TRINITY_DN50037_c0_g1~~TRINITY_DN50037_c0_g1_i1.p1  ORF type:complete len:184 (-),score=33.50 TRINITY_DN50037_c0_g1_i1:114-665(-)
MSAETIVRQGGEREPDEVVGDLELHELLMRVAAYYDSSSCVLALREEARLHVVAVSQAGRIVFEKDTVLIDGEQFQLFHHHLSRPLPIIIDDAASDDRLLSDPCVVDHPHVRFFAAAPICPVNQNRQEGHHGTLCIVDNEPKADFTLMEAEYLCEQAGAVARIVQRLGEYRSQGDLKQEGGAD